LDPEDKIEPLITLLWTVDIHLTILRVFEEDVLPSFIANDPARWTIRRNAVDTSFQIQVSRVRALRSEAEAAKIPLIWFPS
jgi:hypothetical protein